MEEIRMAYYDFYSERRVTGISKWLNARFAQRMAGEIMNAVSPGDTVLEIGSGDGPIARILHGHYRYSGYEPNPVLSDRLAKLGIPMRQLKVPPLLEEDTSQNLVAAIHVLEHMDDIKDARLFVSEIRRVLKPGGMFLAVCPDFRDFGSIFYDIDYSHSFVTTPNRVVQLLVDSGFEIIRRKYVLGPLPFFPGIFFNVAMKLVFLVINPIRNIFGIDPVKLIKMQGTFSRAVVILCRKNDKA